MNAAEGDRLWAKLNELVNHNTLRGRSQFICDLRVVFHEADAACMRRRMVNEITDMLTVNQFVAHNGEWVVAEVDSGRGQMVVLFTKLANNEVTPDVYPDSWRS